MLGQPSSEPKSCSVAVRLHDFSFEVESCPCSITASPSAGMQRGSSARPDVHGFHGSLPPFLRPSLPSCCHPAVHAVTKAMAIQSHNLFQLVFAFIHHFELYFSWRLVVQLSPSCTAALSSALFLGSFAVKSLSHGSGSHGTPGQRGTVWLSAAAYDKAAFAGMCSKTLRSQAGCHMS